MTEEFYRVAIVQDESGHDYMIPHELMDEFNHDLYEPEEDVDFNDKWWKYAVGGAINYCCELYAKRTLK